MSAETMLNGHTAREGTFRKGPAQGGTTCSCAPLDFVCVELQAYRHGTLQFQGDRISKSLNSTEENLLWDKHAPEHSTSSESDTASDDN